MVFMCMYIYIHIGLSISNPTKKHVCSHPNPLNSRGREHFHDWPEALASLCHGQLMLNGLMFSLNCSAAIFFLLVVLCVFSNELALAWLKPIWWKRTAFHWRSEPMWRWPCTLHLINLADIEPDGTQKFTFFGSLKQSCYAILWIHIYI